MAKRRYAGGVISATAPTGVKGMWDMDDQFKRQGAGTWPAQFNVDDVFSTYLYTGNGSTQTITNGIDLSTYGGMVWLKDRAASNHHSLYDTARGVGNDLITSATVAQEYAANSLTAFSSSGFSLGAGTPGRTNNSGTIYTSWTFRKSAKFFDVVTYTGDGTSNRAISHSLGQTPGFVIVKAISTTGNWNCWHRGLSANKGIRLNLTDAEGAFAVDYFGDGATVTVPTATNFYVGNLNNTNTVTYVAYLFAHDTATDGIIQCGSFTTDGSGNATVTLGWEPQFAIFKNSGAAEDWVMKDNMRGMTVSTGASNKYLLANSSAAEAGSDGYLVTNTGFSVVGATASKTYIYLAIRRSNKPPTSGTQVFQPTVYTGTNADNRFLSTTIAPDFVMLRKRSGSTMTGMLTGSRLTGQNYMFTGGSAAETSAADALDQQLVSAAEYGTTFSSNSGIYIGNNAVGTDGINLGTTSNDHIAFAFKRAVGVFDEVCYTGTGSATTVAHSLGVVPELMIVKRRSTAEEWAVYHKDVGNTKYLALNSAAIPATALRFWNDTTPTSSVFTVGDGTWVNTSSATYIARLFATKAGISKVFSVTKSAGSDATVDCGFAAGARFVLLKRTDSTGDWYVWDSARGIVSGNDPYLLLDATSAENTSTDYIDPINAGFTIVNGGIADGSYIGLAFS